MSSSFGDIKRKPGASASQLIQNRRLATLAQTWTFSSKQVKVPSASFIPSIMGRLSGVLAIQNETTNTNVSGGGDVPTYEITASSPTITEGNPVLFTVSTTNVPDGTVLSWQNIGSTSASDFVENTSSGTVTIASGSAPILLTLIVDPTIETGETVQIRLSLNGTVVATSSAVTVVDASPTYEVSASGSTVDEGLSITFTVSTTNVASGTTLYWTTTGTAVAADFDDNTLSGNFTITNGSGTIIRTLTADATTEGGETITLQVRTGSTSGTIVATSSTITVNDTSLTPTPPPSESSLLSLVRSIETTYAGTSRAPSDAGALTINSQSVGNYDLCIVNEDTVVSSFSASDWFTNTQDTHSAVIVVLGNLTINSGQTFIPPVRKLFTVLYVTGNLVCNGTISMTARGANHSGTGTSGGATTAVPIRIGDGTYSGVSNPQIPATGGAGGTGRTTTGINPGSAGISGGTGGGAGGYWFDSGPISGSGSAGTCFSGGTGGGSSFRTGGSPTSGASNGGAGGNAGGISGGGGAGNPGGTGVGGFNGSTGTGGTLVVIVKGSLSGTGTIVSAGSTGGNAGGVTGGGSGGGSVNVLYGTNPSSNVSVSALGGSFGGPGGNGTARKLAIGVN